MFSYANIYLYNFFLQVYWKVIVNITDGICSILSKEWSCNIDFVKVDLLTNYLLCLILFPPSFSLVYGIEIYKT